jgi:hypothetical protein
MSLVTLAFVPHYTGKPADATKSIMVHIFLMLGKIFIKEKRGNFQNDRTQS